MPPFVSQNKNAKEYHLRQIYEAAHKRIKKSGVLNSGFFRLLFSFRVWKGDVLASVLIFGFLRSSIIILIALIVVIHIIH